MEKASGDYISVCQKLLVGLLLRLIDVLLRICTEALGLILKVRTVGIKDLIAQLA